MYPYDKEITELQDAMKVARIALVNLDTKYKTHGIPFAIASALELDLRSLLSTVTVISNNAMNERIRRAVFILQDAGYEVKAPQK